MKLRTLIATAGALVLGAGLNVAVGAHADTGSTSLAFGTETWYEPDPTCSTAVGCLPVTPPAVNLYGAGTLHIAVSAGQETARAYLQLKATTLPTGATIATAPLTIPLDTGNFGSLQPATAKVQACLTTGTLDPSEGSFAQHPTPVCADFVALGDDGTKLTGDIAGLLNSDLDDLAAGKLSLALLPNEPQPTDAWHVVFDSGTPTLTFSLASTATNAPSATAAATTAAPVATTAAATTAPAVVAPPAATTAPAPPPADAVVPAPVAPAASAPAATAPAPMLASSAAAPVLAARPAARVVTLTLDRDYQYPALLLLPAALLFLFFWVVRLMTRDVTPRGSD